MRFAPPCARVRQMAPMESRSSTATFPTSFVGARRGSPLVLGVGKGENFFASDVSAIVAHTREAVYLKDFDIVAVGAG